MRIVFSVFVVLALMVQAAPVGAVIPPPRDPYDPPASVPAQIYGFRYVAGIVAIDGDSLSRYDQPRVWADLSKKDLSLRRQRIDQRTVNDKARKLEKVDVVRIPYKKIDEVWFGEEALKKLAVTNLPTSPRNVWDSRSNSYQPVEVFLEQRHRSPVVVLYDQSRKKRGSLIIIGPDDKSYALYELLLRQIDRRRRR